MRSSLPEGLSATRAAALARSSWMEALLAAMAAALLLAVLFAARGGCACGARADRPSAPPAPIP
jgi:hypothetical protein